MFLHLGGEIAIPFKDIVAIVDLGKKEGKSSLIHEFLENAKREGNVFYLGDEIARSFVLTISKQVYLSPISAVTLKKRLENIFS
ncbi:MAG: DUF370 domain-containing protein [Firmicutes bacterium]|nr:DUF370 domain-containing protein [Bacillota bacterium]